MFHSLRTSKLFLKCNQNKQLLMFSVLRPPPNESELSSELVKGAERTDTLRGLLSVTRGALSQSSGGMFLRLLLGSE